MIGERLEEARKSKGVTIREASEATKIRGEYLTAMEDNSFDISLPSIYVRGFLKNYARYLQLDSQQVLTDYEAHQLGHRSPPTARSNRPARPSYGHMDLRRKNEDKVAESPSDNPADDPVVVSEAPPAPETRDPEMRFDIPSPTEPTRGTDEAEAPSQEPSGFQENRELYIKIGLALAGFIAVAAILVVLIRLLSGSGEPPEINPELAQQEVTASAGQETAAEPAQPVSAEPQPESIIVSASDNVTLIVEQTMNGERLYSGTLNSGETISLEKTGPVSIRFTNGSALSVDKGGRTFRPESNGVGRTVIE